MTSQPPRSDLSPQGSSSEPSRISRYAASVLVGAIFLTPAIGFVWLWKLSGATTDAIFLSHARDMLLRYHARTKGGWPRGWDDLSADFVPTDAGYGTPDLATLRARVEIDFTFEMASLPPPAETADELRIVWIKDRPDGPAVTATNARLRDALGRRAARAAADAPPAASPQHPSAHAPE